MDLSVQALRHHLALISLVLAIVLLVAWLAADAASLVDVGSWRWLPRRG